MTTLIHDYESYQLEVRRRSKRTVANYLPIVRDFLGVTTPTCEREDLRRIDKAAVLAFLRRPTPRGPPPTPPLWNLRLSAIRSFFEYLVDIELVPDNVALKLDRQPVHSAERIPLTFEELLCLSDAAVAHSGTTYATRNLALVLTLIHTGLRVAEVVSLNTRQVDFDRNLLLDVRVKGGKSHSTCLNDVVVVALRDYVTDRTRFHPAEGQQALFLSDRGTRISVRAVQEMVKRFGELAEISTPVTPHILRHSTATRLVESGTAIRVVQEILGHASVTTTERYVHVAGTERRHALDQFAERWKRRQEPAGRAPKKGGPPLDTGQNSASNTQRARNREQNENVCRGEPQPKQHKAPATINTNQRARP